MFAWQNILMILKKGLTTHNVSRHFKQFHQQSPKGLKFWGIERVTKHWRGSNFTRQLSRRESCWIYETNVLTPGGLDVDFDINCFSTDFFIGIVFVLMVASDVVMCI